MSSSYQSLSPTRASQKNRTTPDAGDRTLQCTFLLIVPLPSHTKFIAQTRSALDITIPSSPSLRFYKQTSTTTSVHRDSPQCSTILTYSTPTSLHKTLSSTSTSSSSPSHGETGRLSGNFNAPTHVEIERSKSMMRSFRRGFRNRFSI